jgi:Fic family protein
MKIFDYQQIRSELLTPEIMNFIGAIHEYKGKQELYMTIQPEVLSSLLDIAKIQSTGASNRIEGIYTSEARLTELVRDKAEPKNRDEQEIAGYREVLDTIHESYEHIVPRANIILQLHRDLYTYNPTSVGGRYKNVDNIIEEIDQLGQKRIRFQPLSAFETPEAMEQLCHAFLLAIDTAKINSLLLIPMFILDFLCIHPFNDGNGRMSRLLTLLLLYREGYIVGKYISLEMMIEKTKETYYETLKQSSQHWQSNENDYAPFVSYYLSIILAVYQEFESRVDFIKIRGTTKADRISRLISNTLGKVSKAQIAEKYPDISITTIEKTLAELLKQGLIKKVGVGRSSAYVWIDIKNL